MITYGHEKYIQEAIGNVLKQKADFEIELIVADDNSPDRTEEIVKDIIANSKNGHWIKYTRHNQNIGMMNNFKWALSMCSGKYIALCEGDDYWTDKFKLQKQVDFLESNKDYSICFTNAYHTKEDNHFRICDNDVIVEKEKPNKTLEQSELLYQNCISTLTVIFRNTLNKYPAWIRKVELGDWSLHILNSFFGKIMYLSDITAVYRIHDKGVFSMLGNKKQLIAYINTGEIIRKNIIQSASKMMLSGQKFRIKQLLDLCIHEKSIRLVVKYFLKYQNVLTLTDKKNYFLLIIKLFRKRLLTEIENIYSVKV